MCAPVAIFLCQYIKQKGVHIIVERLVIQEQLGQEAQALAVDLQQAWLRQQTTQQSYARRSRVCTQALQ